MWRETVIIYSLRLLVGVAWGCFLLSLSFCLFLCLFILFFIFCPLLAFLLNFLFTRLFHLSLFFSLYSFILSSLGLSFYWFLFLSFLLIYRHGTPSFTASAFLLPSSSSSTSPSFSSSSPCQNIFASSLHSSHPVSLLSLSFSWFKMLIFFHLLCSQLFIIFLKKIFQLSYTFYFFIPLFLFPHSPSTFVFHFQSSLFF